jgi:uncharacterized membrane protein YeiH
MVRAIGVRTLFNLSILGVIIVSIGIIVTVTARITTTTTNITTFTARITATHITINVPWYQRRLDQKPLIFMKQIYIFIHLNIIWTCMCRNLNT